MGPWGLLKALTLSLRTAQWLLRGRVCGVPRAEGFLWADGPHPRESPTFLSGLNLSMRQRAEAQTRWGAVSIRMCVGGRGGKDHPYFASQGSIPATWSISKDSLTLKTSTGRAKCHRAHTATPIAGQTAQPSEATLST